MPSPGYLLIKCYQIRKYLLSYSVNGRFAGGYKAQLLKKLRLIELQYEEQPAFQFIANRRAVHLSYLC